MSDKRKAPSSSEEPAPSKLATSSGADPHSPRSPARKMSRADGEQNMQSNSMEAMMQKLMEGQEKITRTLEEHGRKADQTKDELVEQIKSLQSTVEQIKQEFETKTGELRASIREVQQQSTTQQKLLANLLEYAKWDRACYLTVKFLEEKTRMNGVNGIPEVYVKEWLKHLGYTGFLSGMKVNSFLTKEPRGPKPLPANTKVYVMDFKVESVNAANMIRGRANDFIQQGAIIELGPYLTPEERKEKTQLFKSEAFRKAKAAAKARGEKIKWGYGTCTIAGEEWTAARVAAAGNA